MNYNHDPGYFRFEHKAKRSLTGQQGIQEMMQAMRGKNAGIRIYLLVC